MAGAWDAGTVYVIEDIDADVEACLEAAFRKAPDRYGFRRLQSSRDGDTFEFVLSSVDDLATLREVQRTIQEVSHDARVPVVLTETSMRFASVSGHGSAEIQVVGTGTPGAQVVLDVGGAVVETTVSGDGRWTAAVSRSTRLSARSGWIYGLIAKRGARQFIRMNVLDHDSYERILESDLPADSLLRR